MVTPSSCFDIPESDQKNPEGSNIEICQPVFLPVLDALKTLMFNNVLWKQLLLRDGGLEKAGGQSRSLLFPTAAPFTVCSLHLCTTVAVLRTPVDRHPGQEKADLGSRLLIRSKAQCIMQLCRRPGSLEPAWVVGPVWEIQRQGFIWGLCLVGVLDSLHRTWTGGGAGVLGTLKKSQERLGVPQEPFTICVWGLIFTGVHWSWEPSKSQRPSCCLWGTLHLVSLHTAEGCALVQLRRRGREALKDSAQAHSLTGPMAICMHSARQVQVPARLIDLFCWGSFVVFWVDFWPHLSASKPLLCLLLLFYLGAMKICYKPSLSSVRGRLSQQNEPFASLAPVQMAKCFFSNCFPNGPR